MFGLIGADGGQVEKRKRDGDTERVILVIGCQSVETAEAIAIGFRAGAARIGRALEVELRKIRPFQRAQLRGCLFDGGALFHNERIRGSIDRHRRFFRRQFEKITVGDAEPGGVPAGELGEGRARNVDGLFGLNRLGSGCGKFRFGAGLVGTRAQFGPHLGGDGFKKNFGAVDTGLRGAHGFLSRNQSHEGVHRRHRHFELGAFHGCLGLRTGGIGDRDVGAAETEVEGFPGDESPDGAAEDRAEIIRADDGAGHRRDHALRLRQQDAEDIVARGAIRLCEGVDSGKVGGAGELNSRRGRVDLLLRDADRGIVAQRVLNGLRERERGLRLLGGQGGPDGQQRGEANPR